MTFIPLTTSLRALQARGNLVFFGLLRRRLLAMTAANSAIILSLSFLLSGCASLNESFECPPGKGVGCVSTMRINNMVNTGELREEDFTATPPVQSPKAKEESQCKNC